MLYYNNGHTQKLGYVGRLVVWVTLGKIDENNLGKGRVKKKVIFIILGSDPSPLKSDNHFMASRPFFEHYWKKVYFFPLKIPKHLEKLSSSLYLSISKSFFISER